MPYIRTIARGGFEQMVAPGASNWNEIFPDVQTALANERRFINEGKAARVLGLFQTVWHDDGETLYEATWYPVLYAAAAAWQAGDVRPDEFADDFPGAFFGVDDATYSGDVQELGTVLARPRGRRTRRTGRPTRSFGPIRSTRRRTRRLQPPTCARFGSPRKSVEQHLYFEPPPLHANAAFVMFLAARRYDAAGAQVSDRRGSASDVRRRASRTRRRPRANASAISSGAGTGCGSCATRTRISRRSTRAPGSTKAATAISRATSSATTSQRSRRSNAPTRFIV